MKKSLQKKFQPFYVGAASFFLYSLGMLLTRSLRLRVERFQLYEEAKKKYGHIIFACWHQQTFVPIFYYRHRDACLITIHGTRGDIITRVAHWLGYHVVRLPEPSAGDRGVKRMVHFVRQLQNGHDSSVAIDGPNGPAFHVRPGVIYLSQQTGYPIIPIGVDARPKRIFKHRWDRYFIPGLFSRTVITVGEPFLVPRDMPIEDGVRALQTTMDALTREAKELNNEL